MSKGLMHAHAINRNYNTHKKKKNPSIEILPRQCQHSTEIIILEV